MLLKLLQATNPDYDADTWADYWALYKGGKEWRARVQRFIARNPQEPQDVYDTRCKTAHYRSYLGPIIDYFVAFLFTESLVPRAKRGERVVDPDPFYAELKEDSDGRGTDLVELLRDRLTRALVDGSSYILAEFPGDGGVPPLDLADWQSRGLGRAKLRGVNRSEVIDFERDADGNLLWAITYGRERPRLDPRRARNVTRHTWRLYDRTNVETFAAEVEDGARLDPEMDVASVDVREHGFNRVPIVELCISDGLWIANRVESSQREHTSLSNANTWLIRRTCFAMPVLKLKTDDRRNDIFGAGYYIKLGVDESFEWAAPPNSPFDAIRQEVESQKDEIHRIVHQMAQGVSNNAAAVGRSGESKAEDAEATRVMLEAIGAVVREAAEKLYQMLAAGRRDDVEWSIDGLTGYSVEDVAVLVQTISQAILIDIPSPTWGREVRKRAALALVPDAAQSTKDAIVQEIEENFIEESVLRPPQVPVIKDETDEDAAENDGQDDEES
jgi:hypothetical protein